MNIQQMNNAFQGQGTPVMCGEVLNKGYDISNLTQVMNNGADKALVAGIPCAIANQAANTTFPIAGTNPSNLVATVATTTGDISGVILAGQTDIASRSGGAPYAQNGEICNVGTFGSGIEVFVKANANTANININTTVYWDLTNGELTTVAPATNPVAFAGKVIGGLVDAVSLQTVSGLVQWTACKALKVRL